MIGCETEHGVKYVIKLEDFRDVVGDKVYDALKEYLDQDRYNYKEIIGDLESELSSLQEDYDLLDGNYDDLEKRCEESDNAYEKLEEKANKLQAFYDYFKELYGKGLEIANWHLNGDLEPFDSFFEDAEEDE